VRLLREDLLAGRAVVTAGPVRREVLTTLERLGARVQEMDEGLDEAAALGWAGAQTGLDGVLYDAAGPFEDGGLMAAIERGWPVVRAVAGGAMISAGAGGRIVLIAPAADAQPHARAAGAALENMARTLSIEWARHGITVTTIAPGGATSDADVATLVAFLLSPGGGYFSGGKLELDGLAAGA
jgi:NAD(P)-dependent dehydrogenase (short-subunit alcohol dehydrogenase family)